MEGSIVTFGSYYQDERKESGKKPIEWIVLDAKGNDLLLLSRYILDSVPYNYTYDDVSWKTSTIRAWLNGSFLNNAFQPSERNRIRSTQVDNSPRQAHLSSVIEEDTVDSIFLLSCTEAYQYLGLVMGTGEGAVRNNAADALMTDYVKQHSAWYKVGYGNWWLRSIIYSGHAFYVQGGIGTMYHMDVNMEDRGVRPAMWVQK